MTFLTILDYIFFRGKYKFYSDETDDTAKTKSEATLFFFGINNPKQLKQDTKTTTVK